MRKVLLLALIVFLGAVSPADAACVDPATLTHSAVSITRTFDDNEKDVPAGLRGVRGTGWFLSPTSMVTVEHVAAEMKLSRQTWKPIDVQTGTDKQSIAVRVQHVAGQSAEKIVVLELQTVFPGAQGLQLRMQPLTPEEPVVSLAYPNSRLRVAGGRFVKYGDGDKFAGTALLELYDGDDRLVLDHGASGAPVLDCTGRVVAVVSNLFTTTMQFMSRAIRISTAWGTPNVLCVPIPVLEELASLE